MKQSLLVLLCVASFLRCYSQIADSRSFSLSEQIPFNFSYDSLSFISCLNTPVGVYAISFKMDKEGNFYKFRCSADSLKDLNKLFINAITKSRFNISESEIKQGKKETFLQIIFFNNFSHCNSYLEKDNITVRHIPDTIIFSDPPYYKEINEILSANLESIRKSFTGSIFADIDHEKVFALPPAIIYWPAVKQTGKSFRNDTEKGVTDVNKLSAEEREKWEYFLKRLEEVKKKKTQQKK